MSGVDSIVAPASKSATLLAKAASACSHSSNAHNRLKLLGFEASSGERSPEDSSLKMRVYLDSKSAFLRQSDALSLETLQICNMIDNLWDNAAPGRNVVEPQTPLRRARSPLQRPEIGTPCSLADGVPIDEQVDQLLSDVMSTIEDEFVPLAPTPLPQTRSSSEDGRKRWWMQPNRFEESKRPQRPTLRLGRRPPSSVSTPRSGRAQAVAPPRKEAPVVRWTVEAQAPPQEDASLVRQGFSEADRFARERAYLRLRQPFIRSC